MAKLRSKRRGHTVVLSELEKTLDGVVEDNGPRTKVHEAVLYVLSSRGKLLRGQLVLALSEDLRVGEEKGTALPAAAAIELLHAASLIHDDLPALDDDDFRRGRPACHKVYGEATAILTGDYMIAAAFSLLSKAPVAPEQVRTLCDTAARTWMMLCVGQQLDIAPAEMQNEAARATMISLKTGALFGAAAVTGCICGGLPESSRDAVFEWGTRIGVLFQRIDDVLDGDEPLGALHSLEEDRERLRADIRALIGKPAAESCRVIDMILSTERLVKAA